MVSFIDKSGSIVAKNIADPGKKANIDIVLFLGKQNLDCT